MDWSRGYTAEWRVFAVDRETWADAGQVARVDSARVERVRGGMVESGELECTREVGEGFSDGYYRIALYARQGGSAERTDVATMLCTAVRGDVDRGRDAVTVECASVLHPASRRELREEPYAPKGCDGAAFAGRLLGRCLHAPVEVEGSFELSSHVVFDPRAKYLDAVWQVLDAGGFCIQVDGDGTVHVRPLPSEPALDLGRAGMRMLMPGVGHALDLSGVPNRYTARDGDAEAVAVNDDPSSPTSTVTRGYVDDAGDSSPVLVNGETLAGYAARKLAEASTVEDSRTYEREYWPGVTPCSLVRCSIPQAGLEGDLRVVRQTLSLGHGIVVTEEAAREVVTWQA